MISSLLLGAALAAVPYAPPEPPLWKDWTLRAELAGGADAWTGGGGAAMEGTLSGWWGRPFGPGRAYAGYSGLLESVPTAAHATWDAHAIDVGMESAGAVRLGFWAHANGGVLGMPPWLGVLAGPTIASDVGATGWLAAQVGPAWRGEAGATSPGYGAVVSGGWVSRDAVRFRAHLQLRRFVESDLPAFLGEIDAAASVPWRDTTLTIASGASWVGPGESRVAGLPAPGAVIARGQIAAETALRGPFTWRIEAGVERGARTVDYVRLRAFTGFAVRLGALPPRSPAVQPSGELTFRLDAPDANTVEIAGTFTAWEPRSMARAQDGAWWITVPLAPGEYEYAYVVDGMAIAPPESPIRRPDGYGGANGVILVTPATAAR